MRRSSEHERGTLFGQSLLTLRKALGLRRSELAKLLGVSRQAVGQWEGGGRSPKVETLKQLIVLGVQRRVFPAGREDEEIRALWEAAHQKVLLDEQWLHMVLSHQHPPPPLRMPLPTEGNNIDEQAIPRSALLPQLDWGEALAASSFYGRQQEVALLTQWVLQERCRLVSVLGMGGIGKSALAVSLMQEVARHFQVALFRSLRDAPCCDMLLDDLLQVLSPQPLALLPTTLERRLSLLIEHLRERRALLVLDNLEAILEEGEVKGRFRPGYEDYGRLLRRIGESSHQSCLLFTSREKPAEVELRRLEGKHGPVRVLSLPGLDAAACEQLFTEKEVTGSPQDRVRLAQVYGGNPLALKIVAETITDLFEGEIAPFLAEGPVIFGSIADLLAEQFARLSPLEQTMLCWLAIVREPVTLSELQAVLVAPLPQVQLLEAIDSLRRRSLIERGQRPGSLTLQSVVLEYVTAILIEQASHEIQRQQLRRLLAHGLCQATAHDYIRETQLRLLLVPILASLQRAYQGADDVEHVLLCLLDQLRQRTEVAQGYGPANLIALLLLLRGHLRGVDLSHLCLRSVYLQGVEMQDATLAEATLRETVFTEALDAIWSVAVSRSGQYWAAGSRRGEVRVWREGGQRLYLLWQAHSDTTFTLAFSPDERTLATGSWDGTVKLWEVHSGTLLWMGWHTDPIFSVAFAPDGHTLASGHNDAVVRLWDVSSGKQVQALASQGGAVYALAWSPDGHLLASGGFDGSIQLWQVQGSQLASCIRRLIGHSNWVHALAFAPDGTQLASGSWDCTVKLWDIASGGVLQTLRGHTQKVDTVAWSPDGGTVASASFEQTIWLWDVAQQRYRAVLDGHSGAIYHVAFTPDSRHLLSGSQDSTIRVWDVTSGQCLRTLEGYAVSFYDIDWSPDGRWLASAGSDLLVNIWEVTGNTRPRALRGHDWIVYGVAWDLDGLLASGGWDNTIRVWDSATGDCLLVLQDPDYGDTMFHGVAWSPDGRWLAGGTYMHGVQVWEMRTRTRCWIGRQHPARVCRVAWSPDGTRLVSCGNDGIYLWEASSGMVIEEFHTHQAGMILSVAWSPDGRRLVVGGRGRGSGEVMVWDVASGRLVQRWSGVAGAVFAVACMPNGDVLVSGDSEGKLHWWEVTSGKCLLTREGHAGAVHALKVSPDGHLLASSGDDSTIRLWDLQNGEMLRVLRRDRPYERLNIAEIKGLTEAQKATLHALGAIEGEATFL